VKLPLIWCLAGALALAGAAAQARRATPEVSQAAILEDRMPQSLAEFGFFIDAPRQVHRRRRSHAKSEGIRKLRRQVASSGIGPV